MSDLMFRMSTRNLPRTSNELYKPYTKEEEVQVTVLEGNNSSDIDYTVVRGKMIDHFIDEASEEITLHEATEIIIEEEHITMKEVKKITIMIKKF